MTANSNSRLYTLQWVQKKNIRILPNNIPSDEIYVLFPLNIPPLNPSNLHNPT